MKKEDNKKEEDQPKKITRQEADRLNNFAQGLEDKITHVVDYGSVLETKDKDK